MVLSRKRMNRAFHFILCIFLASALTACSSRDGTPEEQNESDNTPTFGSNSGDGQTQGPGISTDEFAIRDVNLVYAYRRNSPYASVLKDCILINTVAQSCPLTTLPFIGDGVTQPTIDDIMDRVLVTHDWMGERFESVLRDAPDDLLKLFSSTTAVLMGSTVRPSYYWGLHGAIQLDPYYLWTTLDEKSSVSKQEDFRSDFGADLQFWFLSRTAQLSGDPLAPFYSLNDNSVRPPADVRLPLYRLLFHELTHATDFMPRNEIAGLNTSLSVFDAIDSVRNNWLTPRLTSQHPLTSDAMKNFAQVRYRGLDASPTQQLATAADVGALMANDGAIQFYSYSTENEDLAQLVEGVMMAHHYGAMINVGFTQKPLDQENYTCDDLGVAWGERNRLASPLVNVRARTAADLVVSLSPEIQAFLDNNLVVSESMQQDLAWCDNQRHSTSGFADVPFASPGVLADFSNSNRPNMPVAGELFREFMQREQVEHPSPAISH